MKKCKKSILALLLIGSVLLLGACSKSFDAQGMMNAYMELLTVGESEAYCTLTGSTEEEAAALYQSMSEGIYNEFASVDGVSTDTAQALTDSYMALFAKGSYEVSEAKKVDGEDAYELTLIMNPIQGAFTGYDPLSDSILTTAAENPGFTEEEMNDLVYQSTSALINSNIDALTYGAPQTIDIRIVKEDDVYVIEDEENIGIQIGTLIIDQDEAASGISEIAAAYAEVRFDAKELMEAYMEVITTGETAAYCELTGVTEEEAAAGYQLMLDAIREEFSGTAGVSAESTEAMIDSFTALLSKSKYEVSEAVKVDGQESFDLTLSIYPIQGAFANYNSIFDDIYDAIDANPDMTETELYDLIFQGLADLMISNMDDLSYGDAQTIDIRISDDGSGYTIEDAENVGLAIGTLLIDQSEIQ